MYQNILELLKLYAFDLGSFRSGCSSNNRSEKIIECHRDAQKLSFLDVFEMLPSTGKSIFDFRFFLDVRLFMSFFSGTAKKSPHEAGKSAKKVESVVPSKPAEVKTEDPPAPKAAPAPVSPREEQKAAPKPKTPEASTRTSTSGSVSSSGGSSATPGSGKKRNRKGKKK